MGIPHDTRGETRYPLPKKRGNTSTLALSQLHLIHEWLIKPRRRVVKLVYTAELLPLVGNAQNILEGAGIASTIKNQYTGGGLGELSAFDTWPELWVERDRDYDRAKALLAPLFEKPKPDWQCPSCGETNAESFDFCWRCARSQPDH